MKKRTLSVLATLLLSFCAGADDIDIRSDKFANWLNMGESITFKATGALPDSIRNVNTILADSSGKELERHSIPASEFNASGWRWMPKTPGFRTVTFSAVYENDKESPLGISLSKKATTWENGKEKLLAEKTFLFNSHGIAVLPSPTRKPADIPPQFGASLGWEMVNAGWAMSFMLEQARASALIGFHSVRLQCIELWGLTEPVQGTYDWSNLDAWLENLKKQGFDDFVITLEGTAKWAVEKPDTGVNIITKYIGQPPKDLKLWADYISAIQKRYPFIKKWEIWNEAGMEKQSCFWYGTPEEFCALLKASYETLKRNQPDSQCFLGAPYPPLYEYIVKHGFDKYYDAVSLHGKWPGIERQIEFEKGLGLKTKPWANLEWHAILTSATDYPYPSEDALARNMLISFMNQLRLGSETAYLYGPICKTGGRMDILDFYRQNGCGWSHNFGLFTQTSYTQPRLPALVWRNFTDLFSGNVKYLSGFAFGVQCAALMESSSGQTLLLWQNGKTPASLDPELAKAIGASSELLDWEGGKLDTKAVMLAPEKIVFLKNPDKDASSKWNARIAQVLQKYAQKPELRNSEDGQYRQGRLFDGEMKTLHPETLIWNNIGGYVTLNGKPAPKDFAARYAASFNDEGMDLLVVVKDSTSNPPTNKECLWEGDSVQFAIDAVGEGFPDDRLELTVAQTPDGPLVWKQKSPFNGYLPALCSMEKGPAKYASTAIERNATDTIYRIHMPMGELYPFTYKANRPIRFSLLINNNDGAGRAGWLEWASGIGKLKDPCDYGNLLVDIGAKMLLDQSGLNWTWGNASMERNDSSVKLVSTAGSNGIAALASPYVSVVPGAHYTVSFQAKGNVKLFGMLSLLKKDQGKGRFEFMKLMTLESDWKLFNNSFVLAVPDDVEKASVALYCWQENGSFEIKDFKFSTP